ncbi:MAG: hypothetical protein ACHQIO_11885 [Nevskiales bacterium]
MSSNQFFHILLQAPLVIGLAFGALVISLGLALLLAGGHLPNTAALPRGDAGKR